MPPSSAGDRTTTTSRATWANKPFQAHIRQTPSRIREGVFVCLSGRNRGVSRPFRTALPDTLHPNDIPIFPGCIRRRKSDALPAADKKAEPPSGAEFREGERIKKTKTEPFRKAPHFRSGTPIS